MNIEIPKGARIIIERLGECGYRADIVGGCVRDALLLRTPYDFDITTSATPEEMLRIFNDFRVIETGLAHGTLTVMSEGEPYEVTSYRIDGEYKDGRHPECVLFTRSIEEDLRRRDFTVNAMAYSEKYGLTDLFSGEEDLKKRIIRTVGAPEKRFSEDALRILRALRFASVLSFKIEEKTAEAVHALRGTLSKVSVERIYTEWKKLLAGADAYKIITEFSDVVLAFLPELRQINIPDPERFTRLDPKEKMLLLFIEAEGRRAAEAFLSAAVRLKTDKATRINGSLVLENINAEISNRSGILELLSKIGKECAKMLLNVRFAMGSAGACEIKLLEDLLSDGSVYTISGLNIGGSELADLGFFGKEVGEGLEALLSAHIRGKIKNEKSELLAYAKAIKENYKKKV